MNTRNFAWCAVIGGLAFAGCHSRDSSDPDPNTAPKTGNIANDILRTFSESKQAVHLGHMIEEGCDGIRAFYMGIDNERNAIWSVGCSNSSNYEVMIENNEEGTTVTMDCLILKATTDTDCFTTLASQANRPPRTSKQFMCAIARLPPHVREQLLRQFTKNMEDYLREMGEPVPNTREQLIKQSMRRFDKYARSCDERSPNRSRPSGQSKQSERKTVKKTGSSSQDSVQDSAMIPPPSECSDFKSKLLELATCDSISKDSREALWASYDHSSASRDHVTSSEAGELARWCASSTDKVNAMLTSCHSATKANSPPTQPPEGSADDLLRRRE